MEIPGAYPIDSVMVIRPETMILLRLVPFEPGSIDPRAIGDVLTDALDEVGLCGSIDVHAGRPAPRRVDQVRRSISM